MIDKIYGFMRIVGMGFTTVALIFAIQFRVFDSLVFCALTAVFLLMSAGITIVSPIAKAGRIDIFDENTRPIIFGHLSLLSGVCAMAVTVMYRNGMSISICLGLLAVLVVFMIVMLLFMLRLYNMMASIAKESENKENDDR